MAVKVVLYIPEGQAYGNLRGAAAESLDVIKDEFYTDPKQAVALAAAKAREGQSSVVFAGEDSFVAAKLALIKETGAKIVRSSQIVERAGANLPKDPKEYNVQTALPDGAKLFLSFDGLYSALSCKIGEGSVILAPAEEKRLEDAVGAGAFEDTRSAKDKLKDIMSETALSGKKIAFYNTPAAEAFAAAVKSIDPESELYSVCEAKSEDEGEESAPEETGKRAAAEKAKQALTESERDIGAYISLPDGEGAVTLAVAGEESARIEVMHPLSGEDKKHLMAAAVVRMSEMISDAARDGIEVPTYKETHISQKAFIAALSVMGALAVLCIVFCAILLHRDLSVDQSAAEASATSGSEFNTFDYESMGEVEPVFDFSETLFSNGDLTGSMNIDTSSYYAPDDGRRAGSGFTTVPTTVIYGETSKVIVDIFEKNTDEDLSGENAESSEGSSNSAETEKKYSGKFVFTVYGWGHGVGMSQDGAKAMARSGKSYLQILAAYYPGTVIISGDPNTPMYAEAPRADGSGGMTLLSFLCKTVKQEIGNDAPYEALKAQAVCAYTYAMRNGNFGAGQTIDYNFDYRGTNVERAVMEVLQITSEEQQPHATYISYGGSYINAVYYSNCAGTTTSSTNAWGGARVKYLCGGTSSPEETEISTAEFTAEEMASLIKGYASRNGLSAQISENPAEWLNILSHDGAYSSGIGYVDEINVCGMTMIGNDFRTSLMGGRLKSHCFTIAYIP